MRKIREVLRLKAEGFSDRQIAASIGSARSTVQECLRRCREASVSWPLPAELDEAALHARLYSRAVPLSRTPQPDFAFLHRELKRRGVTRMLLWEEYKSTQPDGWQYSVAILPARVRKPRDKAKVETGVLIVERWILARLRNRQFFSLADLNSAIAELLERLNTRAFKKMAGCRRSRFLELEKGALRPLPPRPYEFAECRKAKVHPDYHIEVARAYYCVPYRLIGERVDVRLTAGAVEIFHGGALIAAHARATERGRRSTRGGHRPASHVAVIENTLNRTLKWAGDIGPATAQVIENQAARRKHPEETLRSAQGILRLAKDFSPERLEAACERALALKSYSFRAVRTLIEAPTGTATQPALDLLHENVRGSDYFQ